jgi:hypothetical protein
VGQKTFEVEPGTEKQKIIYKMVYIDKDPAGDTQERPYKTTAYFIEIYGQQ